MTVLVTGSAGRLGEALMRRLPEEGYEVRGLDIEPGAFVDFVGSVTDRVVLRSALADVESVLHAATLHQPQLATHSRQDFVEVNVKGTLTLLEESVLAGVQAFVYTSTTSAFGLALVAAPGEPAVWVTEAVVPRPRNIYGATKVAAEELCELVHRDQGLPCLILRTSRFFSEPDERCRGHEDLNLKVNELLYRRVDIEDVVTAHIRALERARHIGFGRYIISATTPFVQEDLGALRADAGSVVAKYHSAYERVFAARRWSMVPEIDRVYVNNLARHDLSWEPRHNFATALAALQAGQDPRSRLALGLGAGRTTTVSHTPPQRISGRRHGT